MDADKLYQFWFGDRPGPRDFWFRKNSEFDEKIKTEFGAWLESHSVREFTSWDKSERGRIAHIVLLDQLPRNAYRGTARSFSYDAQALKLAKAAIARGDLDRLNIYESLFLLLPLEHSEDRKDQRESVSRFTELDKKAGESEKKFARDILDFARRHAAIVERFGRFPHRNEILGRPSTPEELAFLKEPGSGF